ALEADPRLRARQGTTGARVHPATEREVLAHVLAVDTELGGALEPNRVAVCRTVQQHHRRPGRDLDAADLGRPPREAEVGLDGAPGPAALLQGGGECGGGFAKARPGPPDSGRGTPTRSGAPARPPPPPPRTRRSQCAPPTSPVASIHPDTWRARGR